MSRLAALFVILTLVSPKTQRGLTPYTADGVRPHQGLVLKWALSRGTLRPASPKDSPPLETELRAGLEERRPTNKEAAVGAGRETVSAPEPPVRRIFRLTRSGIAHLKRHLPPVSDARSYFTTTEIHGKPVLEYAREQVEKVLADPEFPGGTVRLEIDTGRVIGRDALYEIQAGDIRQGKVFFLDKGRMGKEVKGVQGIPPETPLISIVAGDIRASLLLESLHLLGQRLPPGMLRKLDHIFFPSDSDVSVKSPEELRQDLRGAGLYDSHPDLMERLIELYSTLDFVRDKEAIYGLYAVYPGSLGESAPRSLIFRKEKEKARRFWWNHAFLIEHLPPDAHPWAERSARLVKGAEEDQLTDERQAVILEASGLSSVDHLIPVLAYLNRLAPRVVIWQKSRGAEQLASLKNPDLSFANTTVELALILGQLKEEKEVRHVTFLGSAKGASSVEPLVRELDLTFQAAPGSIVALLAGLGVPGELAARLAAEMAEETHLESQL